MNTRARACASMLPPAFLVLIFLVPLLSGISFANPDPLPPIADMTAKAVLSGNIEVTGKVSSASVVLMIPEGIERITVNPNSYEYYFDDYGNKLLKINWHGPKEGAYPYKVELIVKNSIRLMTAEHPIATVESLPSALRWLESTDDIKISDRLRELAWPHTKSYQRVIELAQLSSDVLLPQAAQQAEGSELLLLLRPGSPGRAELLLSMLRAAEIPARFVHGYKGFTDWPRLSPYNWVEVLANNNGREEWVPFDSTGYAGGWLDATQIASAKTPDAKSPEKLMYVGEGGVRWTKNSDVVEALDYRRGQALGSISGSSPPLSFPRNLYGWFSTAFTPQGCGVWLLAADPCKNSTGDDVVSIHQKPTPLWSCSQKDIYWTFGINEKAAANKMCPIVGREAGGARQQFDVEINGERKSLSLSIEGLSLVDANQPFTLLAVGVPEERKSDMLFFSPQLGRNRETSWDLKLAPGIYDFYLWLDGSLASKSVLSRSIVPFSLSLISPPTAYFGYPFEVSVDISNRLAETRSAVVTATLQGRSQSKTVTLAASGEPESTTVVKFNMTSWYPGNASIIVTAETDVGMSAISSTAEIFMPDIPKILADFILKKMKEFVNTAMNLNPVRLIRLRLA